MERRLAAILAADVVGYSRLMEIDEAGTLEAVKSRHRKILTPLLAEYHGRIVKLMGDGALIEFGSAVNAVQCAVALQNRMAEANAGAVENRRILLRVGLNLGDVMVEGTDLYGDGVNIAARLEAMAEPGGVWLSESLVNHVRNKVAVQFEDLGEQTLKNIAQPVRVYRVADNGPRLAASGPGVPAKPSIAVLAFTNLSGDPEQQYFSDGITEDIITGLSRFRQLFVIARHSSFQYRDKAVDVRRVARELGVRFVVEGSLRKAGTRLRVAVQLIDAATGNHVWAERFDRELKDIFAVQDEITQTIVASLAGRIENVDRRRALRKGAGDLSVYDLLLRGKHRLEQGSQRDVLEARDIFKRVLELDPEYAPAYVELAETYFYEAMSGWTAAPAAAAERLFEFAHTAARLDDQDSRAHLALAWGSLHSRVIAEYLLGRFEDAITTFGRMLQPPVAVYGWIAACYAELGRDTEARAAAAEFRERAQAERVGLPEDDVEAWRTFWSKAFPAKERASVERLFVGLRKAGLPV